MPQGHLRRRRRVVGVRVGVLAAAVVVVAAVGSSGTTPSAAATRGGRLAIHAAAAPGTTFPGPRQAEPAGSKKRNFYGTPAGKPVLRCPRIPRPGACRASTPAVVVHPRVGHQIVKGSGVYVCDWGDKAAYRDPNGHWHMSATAHLAKARDGKRDCGQRFDAVLLLHKDPHHPDQKWPYHYWSVKHKNGHPVRLAGSRLRKKTGNAYGAHFEKVGGRLWLVYAHGDGRCHIRLYAKRLHSPTAPHPDPGVRPRVLLGPGLPHSGLKSEVVHTPRLCGPSRHRPWLRKVETGFIAKIRGKFVIAYSAGFYGKDEYKIGLAYSDTFLGPYKKVLRRKGARAVWGEPKEVNYLLQSQDGGVTFVRNGRRHHGVDASNWCHFENKVAGPGVPSLLHYKGANGHRHWYVFFAGHPGEEQRDDGSFAAGSRAPHYLRLRVRIPRHKTVRATSSFALQTWIEPQRDNAPASKCAPSHR